MVLVAGLASLVPSNLQAATLSLKAVRRNDTVITPTNTVSAAPGDRITAEVFISGWNADVAGSQLRTYQYTINGREGFVYRGCSNHFEFVALPCGYDLAFPPQLCESDDDCLAEIAPICADCGVCHFPCTPDSSTSDPCDTQPMTISCPEHLPCCDDDSAECQGPDHHPEMFSFIDPDHANPNACLQGLVLYATSFGNYANIAQGATTLTGTGPVDSGHECYAGTICIEVLPNACAVITVPFINDRMGVHTFLELNPGGLVYPTVRGLTINSTAPCHSGPRIISTMPDNCEIDARAPHSSGGIQVPLGNTVYEMSFDSNMEAVPNDLFVLSFVSPINVGAPTFASIQKVGNEVTLTINRPTPTATGGAAVPTPRWTCITLDCGVPMHNRRCWGHFPGDVDENRLNDTADLEALIGLIDLPAPSLYRCDMNYSGSCTPLDLIEWIDMANGGGAFGPWLNTTMVACPTAGE